MNTPDTNGLPVKLRAFLEALSDYADPEDRAMLLIGLSDQFREVPPELATRPFPKDHQVPGCESEAYVWATMRSDGTLDLHFAVENPSGVSARALATIMAKTLSGAPLEEVRAVRPDIVYRIFGPELSMGKGLGLMAMVKAVTSLARQSSR